MDDSPGGKCEPVIVFECMDLSICQRVNVSGLSCVSNKVIGCNSVHNLISGIAPNLFKLLKYKLPWIT